MACESSATRELSSNPTSQRSHGPIVGSPEVRRNVSVNGGQPHVLGSQSQPRQGQERFQRRVLSVVPIVFVITMSVVVPAMISFAVTIPVVVVFKTAVISFPVTHEVSFAVVARCNPTSSLVGWLSPIASMPLIMISHGVPITLHPHELRTRPFRQNPNHPDGRWRPNGNSNGNLGVNS